MISRRTILYCFVKHTKSSLRIAISASMMLMIIISLMSRITTTTSAFSTTTFVLETGRNAIRKHAGRDRTLQLSLGAIDSQQQQLQTFLMQSVYYKPATEHTQPFWGGTLDPYLTAGKSITPSTKALSEMGITTINDKSNVIAVFGEKITNDHKFIIDSTRIQMEDVLPGFTPTGSLLSPHNVPFDPTIMTSPSPPSVVSFVASIDWASKFINVIDKLPIAVLVYVLVEFFLLRPNINTYKEDIEENPSGIFADTIAVTTVRVSMFCVVAIATLGVFGS